MAASDSELSTLACQTLQKYSERLSQLTLSVRIVQLLCTERVISRETLYEINRLGGVLGDGPFETLYTTVSKEPNQLIIFASVLLKSEQSALVAKDLVKEYYETVHSHIVPQKAPRQNDFDKISVAFQNLIHNVAPLINAGIPTLDDLKRYLQRYFQELKPRLAGTEAFDDVMELIEDKCSIIDVYCIEAIVDKYDIQEAEAHITDFKSALNEFCNKVKLSECHNESFKAATSSSQLTCETIEFLLEWKGDERTLSDIADILLKPFDSTIKFIQIKAINNDNDLVTVTCYAPQYLIDNLVITADENLDLLKENGVIKLVIGYHTLLDKPKREEEANIIAEEEKKELTSQLEKEQADSKEKSNQIESLVKQNEEIIQAKDEEIKELEAILEEKNADEEKLRVESADKQREIETLQEVITSMSMQLRDKEKEIEELQQSLKNLALKPEAREEISPGRGLEDPSLITPGEEERQDAGNVQWVDTVIELISPSIKQCKEVVNQLSEQQTDKEWSIYLYSSSPESAYVILNDLNIFSVVSLDFVATSLDDNCMSKLSDSLSTNGTMKALRFTSCSLFGGIKQVIVGLFTNTSLETLWLNDTTITHEDVNHLSAMLGINMTLKALELSNCNVTDDHVRNFYKAVLKSRSLSKLDLSDNPQITSVSANYMIELINATTSLQELSLHNTSLNPDDVKNICIALQSNNTIQKLMLSQQDQESCEKLDNYELIKDKLYFNTKQ